MLAADNEEGSVDREAEETGGIERPGMGVDAASASPADLADQALAAFARLARALAERPTANDNSAAAS